MNLISIAGRMPSPDANTPTPDTGPGYDLVTGTGAPTQAYVWSYRR